VMSLRTTGETPARKTRSTAIPGVLIYKDFFRIIK
jgi:hypothetical protein